MIEKTIDNQQSTIKKGNPEPCPPLPETCPPLPEMLAFYLPAVCGDGRRVPALQFGCEPGVGRRG